MPNDMADAVALAMRVIQQERAERWEDAYETHRRHADFRYADWAHSRELGFTCGCEGCDVEFRRSLTDLYRYRDRNRDFLARRQQALREGNKKLKRATHRAKIKAKALLHYNLTKEQRWELRATKAFTITGGDGRRYRITEGSTSNVLLLDDNGAPTHRLCVIAKGVSIPVYDLMLAQKLMLEWSHEDFLKLAVVSEYQDRRGERVNMMHVARLIRQQAQEEAEELRQTG